jgi:hypothetical protein
MPLSTQNSRESRLRKEMNLGLGSFPFLQGINPFRLLQSPMVESGASEHIRIGRPSNLLLLVADLVVLLEQVLAKVAAEVAPHGMDVVGVVLRVV